MNRDEALTKLYALQRQGLITIPPNVAGKILGCNPYSLNISAKKDTLNIAYCFVGNRLRISLAGLITFVEGGQYVPKHIKLLPVDDCR